MKIESKTDRWISTIGIMADKRTDIEVQFETVIRNNVILRSMIAPKTVYDEEEGAAVPVDFSVAEYAYDRNKETLDEHKAYNRSGRIAAETSFTWLQEIHHRRAVLPSGYSYSVGMAIDAETDEWFTSSFSLKDAEGRPHGRCDSFNNNIQWKHGIPVSPHKLYLFEYGNDNDGRVYFFPLKDGYFLVDYFYVNVREGIAERLYNIYRIGSDTSQVGFLFWKQDPHMFRIIPREDYYLAENRYFVPVDFVFQDCVLPLANAPADAELYEHQKKAAMAFIDAQELPSEEYNKSARHYEMALEYMERRKAAPAAADSDSGSELD